MAAERLFPPMASGQLANWKVKGRDGAAELLGVNPTTFLARMKKWNITRPAGS